MNKNIMAAILMVAATAFAGEQNTKTQAMNLSARGYTGFGERCVIGGFIIEGADFNILVVRALGPTLTQFHVQNPLQDPVLSIYNQDGNLIAIQDSYLENSAEDMQILIDNNLVPPDQRECAIVVHVTPGMYTGVVRGKWGTEGITTIEGYKVF